MVAGVPMTAIFIWTALGAQNMLLAPFAQGIFVVDGLPWELGEISCFLIQELWLPDMDSNHDSRLQRPLSYL